MESENDIIDDLRLWRPGNTIVFDGSVYEIVRYEDRYRYVVVHRKGDSRWRLTWHIDYVKGRVSGKQGRIRIRKRRRPEERTNP